MNECMKLQNLLKIYGGSNLRKVFKGVKVTQVSNDSDKKKPPSAQNIQEYIEQRTSRSKSPYEVENNSDAEIDPDVAP